MDNIRVRAIIPLNGGIIFVHRIKTINNEVREYYPLPGGGVEQGETLEEGLYREIFEELGLKIKIIKQIYKISDDISAHHIFLCEYVEGEFGTGSGPEFNDEAYRNKGKYLPEIVKFDDLKKTNIVPAELKEQLLKDLNNSILENIEYKEIKIVNTIVT